MTCTLTLVHALHLPVAWYMQQECGCGSKLSIISENGGEAGGSADVRDR